MQLRKQPRFDCIEPFSITMFSEREGEKEGFSLIKSSSLSKIGVPALKAVREGRKQRGGNCGGREIIGLLLPF